MPPPGQTYTGAPPQVTLTSACLMARVSKMGLSVTPARRLPPAPPRNSTVVIEGSQFSPMRSTMLRTSAGMACSMGFSASSSTYQLACSPVVETMSRRKPGQATAGFQPSMMDSGSAMSVPPQPVPGLAT